MKKSFLHPMDIARYQSEVMSGADGRMSGYVSPAELQMGADGRYSNAVAEVAAQLEQQLQKPLPYVLNVSNTTAGTLTATLFGAATNNGAINFNNPTGISIQTSYTSSSYQQLLGMTVSSPFATHLVRLSSPSNSAQVLQDWTVTASNPNGQSVTIPIIADSYFNPLQFQAGILDVDYPVNIDQYTSIQIAILANTTVKISFFPSAYTSPIGQLLGQPNVTRFAAPGVPTALNQSIGVIATQPAQPSYTQLASSTMSAIGR